VLCRLLASHPSEVRDFYDATIASMVSYDEQNRTELVGTLRAYLEADCNMNVTASAVFAHRHTIASRLDRIRELTGLDPARYEDRERLGLGLKVHRLLAPQLESPQRLGATARA
jgi:DNA-binding PucR family transcriptional regulator